jgi:pSer/pThr/pTyr-binding forkhead associated (FHA) protein
MMRLQLHDKCCATRLGDFGINTFPAVVGRGEGCEVSIPVGFVSRRHCRFIRNGQELFVQDLESLNGTYVNGRPAQLPTAIRNGDEVRFGPLRFRVAIIPGHDSGTMFLSSTLSEIPVR